MSQGRHRRSRTSTVTRHVSRVSLVLAAGGAGIAAPLATAATANAAPAPSVVQAGAQTGALSVAQAPAAPEATDLYTVVSGDTLNGIATAEGVEGGWEALYDANRETIGADPNLILPGQELALTAGEDRGEQAASRSAERAAVPAVAKSSYPNNLDGWINEALDIMEAHGIPGTYEGIHRNIMRESSGNPSAINNWDINAQNGTPSIGLLQVIKPTFDAYHVAGTPHDQYDPVANIVAACNYAADRYGSIDNVNGPY
ncbi:LysM peptidoglycan-binding domain-containing protein [Streptomyces sp. JJ66]|uniref:LysM peptidoglycan-binding domain-containing protein n=1 Tax=Streptomyces sp. JJ66 TaxID=2803843 RepID=UPI001C5A28DF|nr:LysM peptidoglycan-binding domain-containing protein [Streptomyces sp. JJ66]MBW1603501.1 LysM peptidoglycan-binding domain-containing protein [Streptomyces sp. JJ66]